jgi:ankyrin repeat protein
MVLAKDIDENTAWHSAVFIGNLDSLNKLWDLAKLVLTPEELNNKLLLAKGTNEMMAWHIAAVNGKCEVLHKLW